MRQVVLDTETTGLDPKSGHRIAEIACLEIIDRRISNQSFHAYINPEREFDEGASQVTGLNWADLKQYPLFADIAGELLAFVKDATLIIHNAAFDLAFLRHELSRLTPPLDNALNDTAQGVPGIHGVIDTLSMARKMHPNQSNSLDALCKRYQINNQHRVKHGALIDVEILAQLYLTMTAGQLQFDFEPEPSELMKSNPSFEMETRATQAYETIFPNLKVIFANPLELSDHNTWWNT